MSHLKNVLRNILFDRQDYCCLCFKTIGESETLCSIEDEVSLYNIEKTEVMYEIVSTVLGDKVLDSISSYNMICQKCTETVVNSYKFIKQCRNNIEQLTCIVESLQNHTKHINVQTYGFKKLFVALDTSNYNVNLHCNSTKNSKSKTILLTNQLKKRNSVLQSIELANIVYDKDNVSSLKCKACLKLYPTATKIKQHFLRVHAPKEFKCPQCPRSFGSSILLQRHKKDCHCKVVCSQCGKTYSNIYSLKHHEQSHKLRLVCQTCGKIYKGKQSFNHHIEMKLCKKMRKSNAEAKLVCDYCGKKYAQKTALSVHIRLEHENGKAVTCEWCSKKFSSVSRLKDHEIKHTKQKDFECDLCGGKFVTKTSLLYHTRRHTGEKPYKCEHCDQAFISASRRSEHVKRHHTETELECDICHCKYNGSTGLLRHRRKHFDVKSRLYNKTPVMLS